MKKVLIVLTVLSILLLSGCPNPVVSSTPVSVTNFQPDGNGYIQFKINDPAKYNYYYWKTYTAATPSLPSVITATVVRKSGAANYGYGVIFGCLDQNNYYEVLVDIYGYYTIWKKVGGTDSRIQDWTYSSSLNTGFGTQNTIKITCTAASGGTFTVSFNNTNANTFSADATIGCTGEAGFIAYLGSPPDESFPNIPADFRFKMSAPVTLP